MAQFMLLLRPGDEPLGEFTPEQAQQMVQRYIDWSAALRSQGKLVAADEIAAGGRTLRARDGRVTVDGPYAETKESIGGYYVIEAADEAEAVEIAKGCPALRDHGVVELRAIVDHSQG